MLTFLKAVMIWAAIVSNSVVVVYTLNATESAWAILAVLMFAEFHALKALARRADPATAWGRFIRILLPPHRRAG